MQAHHLIEDRFASNGNTPNSTPKQTLLGACFTQIDLADFDGEAVHENGLASGPLQGSELQGRTRVVSRYAGIAVFHGLIMALTFDSCKPLKTRRGGRGPKLTLCGTKPATGETGTESAIAAYRG